MTTNDDLKAMLLGMQAELADRKSSDARQAEVQQFTKDLDTKILELVNDIGNAKDSLRQSEKKLDEKTIARAKWQSEVRRLQAVYKATRANLGRLAGILGSEDPSAKAADQKILQELDQLTASEAKANGAVDALQISVGNAQTKFDECTANCKNLEKQHAALLLKRSDPQGAFLSLLRERDQEEAKRKEAEQLQKQEEAKRKEAEAEISVMAKQLNAAFQELDQAPRLPDYHDVPTVAPPDYVVKKT